MKKQLIITALCMAFALPAIAQEAKDPSSKPVSQEIANLQTAYALARYGYQSHSASALIEAAQIINSTSTSSFKCESFEKGAEMENALPKTQNKEFTPAQLISDAKALAKQNPIMLAYIDQIAALCGETDRGRVGGPGKMVSAVLARSVDNYVIAFRANELAEIVVSGDGDTDLDLYVYDENGGLIASDSDYTDDCYVSWVPKWSGSYVVKIQNRGSVYNNYVLLTN